MRYCLEEHNLQYVWLMYYDIGYCADTLPDITSTDCTNSGIKDPKFAYGGPFAMAVITAEAVVSPSSMPFYVSPTQEVLDMSKPTGYILGNWTWRTSSLPLYLPVTYITISHNQTAPKLPSHNKAPIYFQTSYQTDGFDLCEVSPKVHSIS